MPFSKLKNALFNYQLYNMNIGSDSYEKSYATPVPPVDESLLWSRFKNGDESAFIKIYKSYFKTLYNYCLQFDLTKEIIEDNIQDFFIQLRRKHNSLSDTDNIKAYLMKSMRRRMYSLKSRQKFKVEYGSHTNLLVVPSVEDNLIQNQSNQSIKEQINKGLARLSSKQREVIYYFYYEDLNYVTIQQILGYSSPKIVRNLLYKAINSLRKTNVIIGSVVLLAVLMSLFSMIFNIS